MNEVTVNQAYLFVIFILNGILIGLIFDIFRILRKSFTTPNFVTYIEDAIFWTISAISVLYTLFVFNNGEIRGYIFIGLLFGIVIYMLFFSRIIIKISVKVILFFKNIIYTVLKLVSYPFLVILKFMNKILIKPTKFVKNRIYNVKNSLKNCQKLKIKSKNKETLENKEGF